MNEYSPIFKKGDLVVLARNAYHPIFGNVGVGDVARRAYYIEEIYVDKMGKDRTGRPGDCNEYLLKPILTLSLDGHSLGSIRRYQYEIEKITVSYLLELEQYIIWVKTSLNDEYNFVKKYLNA